MAVGTLHTPTELFDDTGIGDNLFELELNPGLTDEEIEDAQRVARMSRGCMLITGMPGAGKDLFGNVLLWKLKWLFKGIRTLRDERPRSLFGAYTLFDEDSLLEDVARMEQIAKGDIPKETRSKKAIKQLTEQIGKWHTAKGEVMLQGAALLLTEFWRYFHNRRPMNPMGILLGGVIKTWRHLDLLIIGIAQQKRELDRFSCLPYITHEVRVSWMASRSDTAECHLYQVRYIGTRGVLEVVSKKPTVYYVDGAKPRPELGIELIKRLDDIVGDRLSSQEIDIVDALAQGHCHNLHEVLSATGLELDKTKTAIDSLIEKEIVSCKRYYDLYNSKSAIALRPRVKFSM